MQVVGQLVGQVEEASAAMLAALLARLRGNIQLPDCLRLVGYLRRLQAFPEAVGLPQSRLGWGHHALRPCGAALEPARLHAPGQVSALCCLPFQLHCRPRPGPHPPGLGHVA